MQQNAIMLPVLAMLLLVMIVWFAMFVSRFKALAAAKVDPQTLATPEAVNQILPLSARNPSNNFKNLFEVPVLFYVLCFYLYLSNSVDAIHLYAAWAFVAFRYLHSFIHCGYNNVNHRFAVYAIACLALWLMLIRTIAAAV